MSEAPTNASLGTPFAPETGSNRVASGVPDGVTSAKQTIPPARYIGSEHVMGVLAAHGTQRLDKLDAPRVLALAVLAGGFITSGALFSVLLASGSSNEGATRLLEGFGFSTGFFFVILAGAILFTETNVVLPAVLIRSQSPLIHVLRFWALAWLGNLLGAVMFGGLIAAAIDLGPSSRRASRRTR